MFSLFKFMISFTISFLILAFPIKGKPVFYYLFKVAAPMTEGVYDGIKTGANASLKKGAEVGWSFFTNAVPPSGKKEEIEDIEANVEEKHFEKDNKQLEALINK
jgi:hypothetical protein